KVRKTGAEPAQKRCSAQKRGPKIERWGNRPPMSQFVHEIASGGRQKRRKSINKQQISSRRFSSDAKPQRQAGVGFLRLWPSQVTLVEPRGSGREPRIGRAPASTRSN